MRHNTPVHSSILAAVSCLLIILPRPLQDVLHWHRDFLVQGDWWRGISGHWLHADAAHLGWNVLALLLLGAYVERHSRLLLWASLGAGTLAVDAYLLSESSPVAVYCGLSGVLNTLLFVALWLIWCETRSRWVIVTTLLATAKILLEIAMRDSLFTSTSWPPLPEAHLAGMAITPLVLWCWAHRKSINSGARSQPYEYLDAGC